MIFNEPSCVLSVSPTSPNFELYTVAAAMLALCETTKKLFAPINTMRHGHFSKEDVLYIELTKDRKFILDAYRKTVDRATGRSMRGKPSIPMVEALERLPEQKPLKGADRDSYHDPILAGGTDCTVELITALVPAEYIRFADDDTKAEWQWILQQSLLADSCASVMARYKETGRAPEHGYELHGEKPLAPYQQVGLYCAQQQSGFLLAMAAGTGKTPVGIASVCNGAAEYRAQGTPGYYKTIILCPKGVRHQWAKEFYNFSTRPGRVTILAGTQIERVKQLCEAFAPDPNNEIYFSAVICGYQTLWRSWESLRLIRWNLAIVDEAHNICTVDAIQSKAAMELRDNSEQRIAMTGTPIKNSPLDVYNILEFLEKGGSGFSDHKAFKKYYGQYTRSATGHEIETGFQNLPILQERLARKSFFISLKDAIPNLPDKRYDLYEVEMTAEQRQAYNKLQRELAIEIDEKSHSGMPRSMLVTCILTELLRLSQITSGFVTWDAIRDPESGELLMPKEVNYFYPNPKIDAIMELIADKAPEQKTIIWAHWIPDIEYVVHALHAANHDCAVFRGLHSGYKDADRDEAKRKFNEDRNCRFMVATQSSGGAGLNLLGYPEHGGNDCNTNCDHAIYMSQNWSQVHRTQSEERNFRRGVRGNCRYTTLIVPGTIDQDIHEAVTDKRITASQVADLGPMLKRVLNINADLGVELQV